MNPPVIERRFRQQTELLDSVDFRRLADVGCGNVPVDVSRRFVVVHADVVAVRLVDLRDRIAQFQNIVSKLDRRENELVSRQLVSLVRFE